MYTPREIKFKIQLVWLIFGGFLSCGVSDTTRSLSETFPVSNEAVCALNFLLGNTQSAFQLVIRYCMWLRNVTS